MAKRSSVDVIAAEVPKSATMEHSESCSVSVRKIDNGYVTCTSRCNAEGYHSEETFSKSRPVIEDMQRRPQTNPGRETMRGAMHELRRK